MARDPSTARERVVELLTAKGPLTGSEIAKATGMEGLLLWKTCRSSEAIAVRALGKRYLRLDRQVEGFARLSPSILREFLTYSVVGLAGDLAPMEARCLELSRRIREINDRKLGLARRMVSDIVDGFREEAPVGNDLCFILAGDIVHGMAHEVPRPERSTGKLVRGSDIDLVVVAGDSFPDAAMKKLDSIVYAKKRRMLIDPSVNEEVDYVIKRLATVRKQASFDEFRKMIAIKILREGVLLAGSEPLFAEIKAILEERGLTGRLEELERKARDFRIRAEEALLENRMDPESVRRMRLFYSSDEFEEFE